MTHSTSLRVILSPSTVLGMVRGSGELGRTTNDEWNEERVEG